MGSYCSADCVIIDMCGQQVFDVVASCDVSWDKVLINSSKLSLIAAGSDACVRAAVAAVNKLEEFILVHPP